MTYAAINLPLKQLKSRTAKQQPRGLIWLSSAPGVVGLMIGCVGLKQRHDKADINSMVHPAKHYRHVLHEQLGVEAGNGCWVYSAERPERAVTCRLFAPGRKSNRNVGSWRTGVKLLIRKCTTVWLVVNPIGYNEKCAGTWITVIPEAKKSDHRHFIYIQS